jgi:hypothetical protein
MIELSTKGFVVFLISNASQKVQAVQVMKDFHTNSIPFLSGGGMINLERSLWHIQLRDVRL